MNREEEKTLKEIIGQKDFKLLKKKLSKKQLEVVLSVYRSLNLANAMGHCFWVGDKNHTTLYANKIYQKTTEYPLEECIGKTSDFCFDKESKKRIAKHHRIRNKGLSSQYEATYVTKSGKKVPMLIIGAPHEKGGAYGMHINLTEIKKLAQKEKISDQIVRNSPEAIVILDKKGKIQLWNAGAEKIFGYTEEEVLSKDITVIAPKDAEDEMRFNLKEAGEKKFLKNIETQRQAKNGDILDVSVSVTKVTDSDNKFIGYLVIYRDISHQKRVNSELQKRFETIQDAYKELGLQKRQIDYIYEISNTAASNATLNTLCNLIVSAISLLTKCDGAVLRLYETRKDMEVLKLQSCIGVNQKWLSKNKINLKNSLAEEAVKNSRPLIIENVDTSSKHKGIKLLKAHKFSTVIILPLLLPNKTIGTISLYATDPGKFRFIETDFLENFSKQAALAINAKICN